MEHALLNLVHAAAWAFLIIFLLALVGVIAIIRWIADAVRTTETAVEGGVQNVEERFKR
ncbi:MAG: hypothetical protein ABR508_05070 [Candidatus Baltobacteraceae bacterium]